MNAPSIKNRASLQNGKRTGKQGKAVPTLLLAAVQILLASHLASKVAWSHFSLVGEICPQAPLNDFCKIGCAPFRRFSENETIPNPFASAGQGIGVI